jgi:hypothetical protein
MKKSVRLLISFSLLLSCLLSACNFGGFPNGGAANEDQNLTVAQTLAAIAFTQTAMAQETAPAEPQTTPEPTPTVEAAAPEEEAPVVEVTHNIRPGEPGWVFRWFYDTDASQTASGGYVNGGDDFVANLYERPFTATEMNYRPDIDINKAEIAADETFIYVTIYPHALHPDGNLQAAYGVEIDTDRDGRGDLLVVADRPASTEWEITGVSAYSDMNNDVGDATILRPDAAASSDGYEKIVFSQEVLDDPDAAWARMTTGTPPSVTIAFKRALIPGASTFVWGVWAAESLLQPTMLDLHDHYTQTEAGSPYAAHSSYPLAALNLLDNTCRETFGFEATSPIPGLCTQPEPPSQTEDPSITTDIPEVEQPTHTPTPTDIPLGSITAVAFDDNNNDGDRDPGEPLTVYSITIRLRLNNCGSTVLTTTTSKNPTFSGLTPGTYCVQIVGGGTMTTPSQYTVTVPPNGSIYVEFGFYVII